MFRILLPLVIGSLLAAACGAAAVEPEPTATATTVPATATPTPLSQAELERLLVKISVPCREIFLPGLFETLGEGYEPLTSDDIRNGVVAEYQVVCMLYDLVSEENSSYPDSVFLTISAFESPEAARESVSSNEGEGDRFVFTAGTDPSLGDKSAATSVVDKETGENGELIEVAVGNFAIIVDTLGAEEELFSRAIAVSAAEAMTENAAAMR